MLGDDFMVLVTESELSFFKNKTDDYITNYFIGYIDAINNDNRNILYISYNFSKKVLLSKFNSFDSDNIVIVDNLTLTCDNLQDYIKKYKPRYVFIDYLNLNRKNRYWYLNDIKFKDLKEIIEKFEQESNVIFIVAINDKGDVKYDK